MFIFVFLHYNMKILGKKQLHSFYSVKVVIFVVINQKIRLQTERCEVFKKKKTTSPFFSVLRLRGR